MSRLLFFIVLLLPACASNYKAVGCSIDGCITYEKFDDVDTCREFLGDVKEVEIMLTGKINKLLACKTEVK